jgi:hypothetical protein
MAPAVVLVVMVETAVVVVMVVDLYLCLDKVKEGPVTVLSHDLCIPRALQGQGMGQTLLCLRVALVLVLALVCLFLAWGCLSLVQEEHNRTLTRINGLLVVVVGRGSGRGKVESRILEDLLLRLSRRTHPLLEPLEPMYHNNR